MPGCLVQHDQQPELLQREVCVHRRVNQLLVRIMVKSLGGCSHRVPVCFGPLAPSLRQLRCLRNQPG